MFTTDNGLFHGEHRIPGGKTHIYEESIRVPLQMRGPGIPPGVRVSDLSINADLAPTIVDVANASPGLVMDGRSLIPVAQQPGIEQGRELLIEEPGFEAIRTERYMYAEHSTGERELYDLKQRPVRAPQPPRRSRLRSGPGPARGAPQPAAKLLRLELPGRSLGQQLSRHQSVGDGGGRLWQGAPGGGRPPPISLGARASGAAQGPPRSRLSCSRATCPELCCSGPTCPEPRSPGRAGRVSHHPEMRCCGR